MMYKNQNKKYVKPELSFYEVQASEVMQTSRAGASLQFNDNEFDQPYEGSAGGSRQSSSYRSNIWE